MAECRICFENMDEYYVAPCYHEMCRTCSDRWTQSTCPFCRCPLDRERAEFCHKRQSSQAWRHRRSCKAQRDVSDLLSTKEVRFESVCSFNPSLLDPTTFLGVYIITVTCTLDAPVNGFFSLRPGNLALGNEYNRTGAFTNQTTSSMTIPFVYPGVGPGFVITFFNQGASNVNIVGGAGTLGLINDVKIYRCFP